jgi:MraZ protein
LFRGVNALSLDAKGRMAMPARYRERVMERAGGNLVITIDTGEKCLWIYPLPEWEAIQAKLDALPAFNANATKLRRLLMGYATDTEMDNTGRILVAPELRKYAGLDHKVVLVGQGKKFELWNEELWNTRRDQWLAEGVLGDDEALSAELQNLVL